MIILDYWPDILHHDYSHDTQPYHSRNDRIIHKISPRHAERPRNPAERHIRHRSQSRNHQPPFPILIIQFIYLIAPGFFAHLRIKSPSDIEIKEAPKYFHFIRLGEKRIPFRHKIKIIQDVIEYICLKNIFALSMLSFAGSRFA